MKDLKLTAKKSWREFPKNLQHGPSKTWNSMMKNKNSNYNKTSRTDLEKVFSEYLEIYTLDTQAKTTLNSYFERKLSKLIAVNHPENTFYDDNYSTTAVDEEMILTHDTQGGSADVFNNNHHYPYTEKITSIEPCICCFIGYKSNQ